MKTTKYQSLFFVQGSEASVMIDRLFDIIPKLFIRELDNDGYLNYDAELEDNIPWGESDKTMLVLDNFLGMWPKVSTFIISYNTGVPYLGVTLVK